MLALLDLSAAEALRNTYDKGHDWFRSPSDWTADAGSSAVLHHAGISDRPTWPKLALTTERDSSMTTNQRRKTAPVGQSRILPKTSLSDRIHSFAVVGTKWMKR
jgi:hypothetical protein